MHSRALLIATAMALAAAAPIENTRSPILAHTELSDLKPRQDAEEAAGVVEVDEDPLVDMDVDATGDSE